MKEDGPKAGYLIGYRIVMGHFRPPSNKGPPTEGLSERAYLGHFVYKVNQVAAVVASKVWTSYWVPSIWGKLLSRKRQIGRFNPAVSKHPSFNFSKQLIIHQRCQTPCLLQLTADYLAPWSDAVGALIRLAGERVRSSV